MGLGSKVSVHLNPGILRLVKIKTFYFVHMQVSGTKIAKSLAVVQSMVGCQEQTILVVEGEISPFHFTASLRHI